MDLRASTVDITTPDGIADAFVTAPEGRGPYPGVLLYMDAFGPRPRLEEMAKRIADEGYVVLVPHVFYRQGRAPLVDTSVLMDPEARGQLFETIGPWMKDLTPQRAMSDADAYLDYLVAHDEVADGPIGVVGYCMGGALALRTAAHRPDQVAAAAAFHPARLATDEADSPHLLADRIRAEVYVASADNDQSMTLEAQQTLDRALTDAKVPHTCEQYDGAAHGFTMADTAVFHEEATQRHWDAMLPLLDRALH